MIASDLNASETLDTMWPARPRGSREILDRMQALGLCESLRRCNGALVPAFRNPRGSGIVHQMDPLLVSEPLAKRLVACQFHKNPTGLARPAY